MKGNIKIQNLRCGGCAKTITSNLSNISNITNLIIDIDNSTIMFEYDKVEDYEKVTNKLNELGYPLDKDKNTLVNKAKSIISCFSGKVSS